MATNPTVHSLCLLADTHLRAGDADSAVQVAQRVQALVRQRVAEMEGRGDDGQPNNKRARCVSCCCVLLQELALHCLHLLVCVRSRGGGEEASSQAAARAGLVRDAVAAGELLSTLGHFGAAAEQLDQVSRPRATTHAAPNPTTSRLLHTQALELDEQNSAALSARGCASALQALHAAATPFVFDAPGRSSRSAATPTMRSAAQVRAVRTFQERRLSRLPRVATYSEFTA